MSMEVTLMKVVVPKQIIKWIMTWHWSGRRWPNLCK